MHYFNFFLHSQGVWGDFKKGVGEHVVDKIKYIVDRYPRMLQLGAMLYG